MIDCDREFTIDSDGNVSLSQQFSKTAIFHLKNVNIVKIISDTIFVVQFGLPGFTVQHTLAQSVR